jgi:four helix bundle protein
MGRPHEKLEVWMKAIDLAENIYQLTKKYPKDELYGIILQMRRAVISIGCNIAEGAARQTKTEFKQFLYMARGSISELETQLLISKRLNYINDKEYQNIIKLTDEIGRMLTSLIKIITKSDN